MKTHVRLLNGLAAWLAMTVVLVWTAVTVDAQGPGRGGFFFGGGPGGPGGFNVFATGGPVNPMALIGIPEVRQELKVDAELTKKIDELLAEQQQQSSAVFGSINFQELQDLDPADRDRIMNDARLKSEEITRKYDERLLEALPAPQRERLEQLRLQREGAGAFGRDDVRKKLAISDEQKSQIERIQEAARPNFGGFGPPDFSRIEEQRKKALVEKIGRAHV